MNALPDDVLPLFAGGSNRLLARIRAISRRFAAVCVVPPLEHCGDVLRRGGFMVDLATKYDPNVDAPVLSRDDMVVLSEVLGSVVVEIRAFVADSVCARPTIKKLYFHGVHNTVVNIGMTRVYFYGDEIKFRGIMCQSGSYHSLDMNGPRSDNYLVVDGVYWSGYAYAVGWMAGQVESTILKVVHL
jgi:hypothetical protein